jgi:hopanoid biosynthesis associated protein HpnK
VQRSLVVNADDLGLTKGVNDGIFTAHAQGILTSASLFATAPATADAVSRLRERPSLGIGCHLTLVDGQPTLSLDRVPSLVTGDGRFRRSWKPFIVACLTGWVSLGEIEHELSAQIERLRDNGLNLTHLDAHKHVHAFPPIFRIVARLATRYGIPAVRVPFETGSVAVARSHGSGAAWRQAALNLALHRWARLDRQIAATHGLRTGHFVGRVSTGLLSADTLDTLFRRLRPGVTELMVHPGYFDDDLDATDTRLRQSRTDEVHLLCAQETKDLVTRAQIALVRHDLALVTERTLRHAS